MKEDDDNYFDAIILDIFTVFKYGGFFMVEIRKALRVILKMVYLQGYTDCQSDVIARSKKANDIR